MFLQQKLNDLQSPIKIAFIGCGKFISMFLSQYNQLQKIKIDTIIDLDIERAKKNCKKSGLSSLTINEINFSDSLDKVIDREIDIFIEATGNPIVGTVHAKKIINKGRHVILVNVEADVVCGKYLSDLAKENNVVCSMAYGDQPALTIEMVEWARATGFEVIAAGKGTKYLPAYHSSTPDTVWDHYGLTAEQAKAAGMNSQMFNSFLDGTKSALEMAAISNATGLSAPSNGLGFPAAGMDDLAHILRPQSEGGCLEAKGQVEVVTSIERDGRPVHKDLRWGVYVVIEAPNDYAAACFKQYGMNTDASGRYSAMYKPFHLIGLELNISILSAALLGQPTGMTKGYHSDVVATAKRPLKAGEMLDGEGGFTVWGKLCSARQSAEIGGVPIGLAHHLALTRDVPAGAPITWQDVGDHPDTDILALRKKMQAS